MGKKSRSKREKKRTGAQVGPPPSWRLKTGEEVKAAVERVELRAALWYQQAGRPIPRAWNTFLCVVCDSGEPGPALPEEPKGQVLIGDGCPDCGRPDAGAWLAWMASNQKPHAPSAPLALVN